MIITTAYHSYLVQNLNNNLQPIKKLVNQKDNVFIDVMKSSSMAIMMTNQVAKSLNLTLIEGDTVSSIKTDIEKAISNKEGIVVSDMIFSMNVSVDELHKLLEYYLKRGLLQVVFISHQTRLESKEYLKDFKKVHFPA